MKKTLLTLGLLLVLVCRMFAQTTSASIVNFSIDGGASYQSLEAVRVGEYLWLNKDYKRPGDTGPATEEQLEKIFHWYNMFLHKNSSDPNNTYWSIYDNDVNKALAEFNKHYGTYFTRGDISNFQSSRQLLAKESGELTTKKWKLPTNADVLQLVAMCGHGTLNEVRQFLSYSHTDTSAPDFVYKITPNSNVNGYWWFDLLMSMGYTGHAGADLPLDVANNNKYGFNMLPNGTGKFHGAGSICTVDHANNNTPICFDNVVEDDFNGLFMVGSICTGPASSLSLNDIIEIKYASDFAKHNVRFCRPLTDEELGYKLYINQDMESFLIPALSYAESTRVRTGDENLLAKIRNGQVNISDIQIVKKGINEPSSEGFYELPRGYIRGFYVQYVLGKTGDKQKTIEEIFEIALANKNLWIDPYRVDTPKEPLKTTKLKVDFMSKTQEYDAIRIGEYMWINSNINQVNNPISQSSINNMITGLGVDPNQYSMTPEVFQKTFGDFIYAGGILWNDVTEAYEDGVKIDGWKVANDIAYDQLFGMCGFATTIDEIRNFLGCKVGDNEAAQNIEGTVIDNWFRNNMNYYGFNMLPVGHMRHNTDILENFFTNEKLHVRAKSVSNDGASTVYIENAPTNVIGAYKPIFVYWEMNYMTSRLCRRLTNEELGYRIFINNNDYHHIKGGNELYTKYPWETDIKVIYNPNATAPEGYTELSDGRFRGLYVQMVLGNNEVNPQQLEEVYGYYKITSALYESCLTDNNDNLLFTNFNDKEGQHWRIEKKGTDFSISLDNSKVLTYEDEIIKLLPANNSESQLWNIFDEGNGLYTIAAKSNTSKVLEVLRDVNTTLTMGNYAKKSSQKFRLPHSALYLVGDATEAAWDLSKMEKILPDSLQSDIFIWKGELKTGTLKINPLKDSFAEALNASSENVSIYPGNTYDLVLNYQQANDYRFNITRDGYYTLTIDLNTKTLSIVYAENPNLKDRVDLVYSSDNLVTKYNYTGVRIGEYYWMNSNFYNPQSANPTSEQLERVMAKVGLNSSDYVVDMGDFNRYYGAYYTRGGLEEMVANGNIYEGADNELTGWRLPTVSDFEQLFGMCGNGSNADVRKYLGAKEGGNPVAFSFNGMQWFKNNTNFYDFNMMPGGARAHNNGDFGSGIGYLNFGDFYDLFIMSRFVANGAKTITIKDGHARVTDKLFHMLNMRWCRKMTDQELGYKLYVNIEDYNESVEFLTSVDPASVDIIKVDFSPVRSTVPTGYYELPEGYLRGFYVQNYFNSGIMTSIEEMVKQTKEIKGVGSTTNVIKETVSTRIYVKSNTALVVKSNKEIESIQIHSMDGRLLSTYSKIGTEVEIPILTYPTGVYIVSVKDANGMVVEKISKK